MIMNIEEVCKSCAVNDGAQCPRRMLVKNQKTDSQTVEGLRNLMWYPNNQQKMHLADNAENNSSKKDGENENSLTTINLTKYRNIFKLGIWWTCVLDVECQLWLDCLDKVWLLSSARNHHWVNYESDPTHQFNKNIATSHSEKENQFIWIEFIIIVAIRTCWLTCLR